MRRRHEGPAAVGAAAATAAAATAAARSAAAAAAPAGRDADPAHPVRVQPMRGAPRGWSRGLRATAPRATSGTAKVC